MPTDPPVEPWSETTYRGFAGPAQPNAGPPSEQRGPGLSPAARRNLAIGAAAALALGLVLGVWARPDLGGKAGSEATARPMAGVPIEVNQPPPQPTPSANGKLEVLSPDQAAAAGAPAYAAGPSPLMPSLQGAPAAAPMTAPPRLAQVGGRAGFDCAGARGEAEQMVCGDPELAAADREMSRAYRRALQSGAAAPGALRADQRDWLSIREDAARHSRRALAEVYQQRIDELNGLAAGDRPSDEGGPGD